MTKIIHELEQGSPEWHAHRAKHFNASEAPIMLGMSPYMTRSELLKNKALGIDPEFNESTKKLFELGHQYEAMARPWVEERIAQDLYPSTISMDLDGLPLSASFDGLTMDDAIVWEHKSINDTYRQCGSELPLYIYAQLEQQLLISGASEALFTASNGTLDDCVHVWYASNLELRASLIAGWKQFKIDLENYKHVELPEAPQATAIEALPALSIELIGEVKESNIAVYKTNALAYIENINTELSTDQHFANAESDVKFCEKAEKELDLVKKQALSKTQTIDELFRTIDVLREAMRSKRLTLEKLVTARKETIRAEIKAKAVSEVVEFYDALNKGLGEDLVPAVSCDFQGVMKSKKLISSIQDAVKTEVARVKIEASRVATIIQNNLRILEEKTPNHAFLFMDRKVLVLKDPNDLINLIEVRISKHKEAEDKRLEAEREKIRKEEIEKLEKAKETQPVIAAFSVDTTSPISTAISLNEYVSIIEDEDLLWLFVVENIEQIARALKVHTGKKLPGVKFVPKFLKEA